MRSRKNVKQSYAEAYFAKCIKQKFRDKHYTTEHPIGYYFANAGGIPLWGVIAAIVASLFERYEFGIIDDNILVTISATVILFLGGIFGPLG